MKDTLIRAFYSIVNFVRAPFDRLCMNRVQSMCEESSSPDTYCDWISVKTQLLNNRQFLLHTGENGK